MTISVLHNSATMNLGGAESRIMDIFRALDRRKFNFDFVVYSDQEQYFEKEIMNLGGKIHRIPSPREGLLAHIREFRALLRTHRYDVVHSHTSYHSGLVLLIAWTSRVQTRISHARTSGSMSAHGFTGRINRKVGATLIRTFATDCLAISKEAAEFVFGGASSYTLLPDAINVKHYLTRRSRDDIRTKFRLPTEAIIIGHVGRHAAVKNQEFSVHILKNLIAGGHNARLVLVGDGPDRTYLETLAETEGLEDYVHFTGNQRDVAPWLASFDVLLMPSLYEGLGNVALEAQATGIPVITSDRVPRSVDLGLSLVDFLALELPISVWGQTVVRSLAAAKPTDRDIYSRFSERGYTIDNVVDQVTHIYSPKS